jgi:hypothetical protein
MVYRCLKETRIRERGIKLGLLGPSQESSYFHPSSISNKRDTKATGFNQFECGNICGRPVKPNTGNPLDMSSVVSVNLHSRIVLSTALASCTPAM